MQLTTNQQNLTELPSVIEKFTKNVSGAAAEGVRAILVEIRKAAAVNYLRDHSGNSSQNYSSAVGGRLHDSTRRVVNSLIGNDSENVISVYDVGGFIRGNLTIENTTSTLLEFGGTLSPVAIAPSDRMRRFLFARYYATGEKKFRYAAVSRQVVIPARDIKAKPFLLPALDEVEGPGRMKEMMLSCLQEHFSR